MKMISKDASNENAYEKINYSERYYNNYKKVSIYWNKNVDS